MINMRGHFYRLATIESVLTGFGGQLLLIGSGVFSARMLHVEGRGILTIILLFPTIISLVGSFGFPQAVTYYTSIQPQNIVLLLKRTVKIYLYQTCGLSLVLLASIYFFIDGKPIDLQISAVTTVLAVSGVLAEQYGLALLQGMSYFRLFNLSRLLQPLIYTIIISGLLLGNYGSLLHVTIAWVFSSVIAGIVILGVTYRAIIIQDVRLSQPLPSIKEMFLFGAKGFVGSGSPLEIFRVDQLVAGFYLSPVALGMYVVGKAFTNLPRFVAQSAGMVFFPALATLQKKSNVHCLFWKFVGIVGLFNFIVTVILILTVPILIPLFFGSEFMPATPLAQILLGGTFFLGLRMILAEGMRGLGYPQVSTFAEFVMYLSLFLCMPLLIFFLNLRGLVMSLSISYVIAFIFTALISTRILKQSTSSPDTR
jgi:O-antigen/teichoic acid export membrane protein